MGNFFITNSFFSAGKKIVLITFGVAGFALLATLKSEAQTRSPDIHYVPTPQGVVDKMLEAASVGPDDIVYDLGCGDGRIVVTAAKRYGVRAYGYDIDPVRVAEARENVRRNNVEHLVTIEEADIFDLDLSEATVVALYLLPSLNVKLMPQLRELSEGSRIVSHDFDMRGAKPERVIVVEPENEYSRSHRVYLWTVPWEEENNTATFIEE